MALGVRIGALPFGGQCVAISQRLTQSCPSYAPGAVERGRKRRNHDPLKNAWHKRSWTSAHPIPYPQIPDRQPRAPVLGCGRQRPVSLSLRNGVENRIYSGIIGYEIGYEGA